MKAAVVALAFGKCVHTTPGATADAPQPVDAANNLVTSAPFTVMLCTSGTPGDPTCPYNNVQIIDFSPIDIRFVAQSSATWLSIQDLSALYEAQGPEILAHPLFISYPPGGPPLPDPNDSLASVVIQTSGPFGPAGFLLPASFATTEIAIQFERQF